MSKYSKMDQEIQQMRDAFFQINLEQEKDFKEKMRGFIQGKTDEELKMMVQILSRQIDEDLEEVQQIYEKIKLKAFF